MPERVTVKMPSFRKFIPKLTTEQFDQLYQRNKQVIEQFNRSSFADDFSTTRTLYTDLPCIKDIRLGLLLALSTPEQVEYIRQHLADYETRPDRSFLSEFPELPYTEEQLLKLYADPTYSNRIFNHAPDTDLAQQIETILRIIRQQNVLDNSRDPVTWTINVYPLAITDLVERYRHLWELYLLPLGTEVRVVSLDPLTIPGFIWEQQEMLILDRFTEMIDSESVPFYNLFYKTDTFYNRVVIAYPCIAKNIRASWDKLGYNYRGEENLNTMCNPTHLLLQFYCKFHFSLYRILQE